jgi:hypothetical protein
LWNKNSSTHFPATTPPSPPGSILGTVTGSAQELPVECDTEEVQALKTNGGVMQAKQARTVTKFGNDSRTPHVHASGDDTCNVRAIYVGGLGVAIAAGASSNYSWNQA